MNNSGIKILTVTDRKYKEPVIALYFCDKLIAFINQDYGDNLQFEIPGPAADGPHVLRKVSLAVFEQALAMALQAAKTPNGTDYIRNGAGIKVISVSDCAYERLTAEMYFVNKYIGLLNMDDGFDNMQIEFPGDGLAEECVIRQLDLAVFEQALEMAIERQRECWTTILSRPPEEYEE